MLGTTSSLGFPWPSPPVHHHHARVERRRVRQADARRPARHRPAGRALGWGSDYLLKASVNLPQALYVQVTHVIARYNLNILILQCFQGCSI